MQSKCIIAGEHQRELNRLREQQVTEAVDTIAKGIFQIETLKTRGRDSLDFHSLPVWEIKEALRAAYFAGRAAHAVEVAR